MNSNLTESQKIMKLNNQYKDYRSGRVSLYVLLSYYRRLYAIEGRPVTLDEIECWVEQ